MPFNARDLKPAPHDLDLQRVVRPLGEAPRDGLWYSDEIGGVFCECCVPSSSSAASAASACSALPCAAKFFFTLPDKRAASSAAAAANALTDSSSSGSGIMPASIFILRRFLPTLRRYENGGPCAALRDCSSMTRARRAP